MNLNKAINIWESTVQELLSFYNDIVEIHYKPERSGIDPTYDSFFNESVDSTNPNNFSNITETEKPPVQVTGKFHSDLYSYSFASNDIEQQTNIGEFQQSDALFTCLYNDAVNNNEFIFDNVDYIISFEDNEKYEIVSVKKRGFKDIYLVDVFLKRTNK